MTVADPTTDTNNNRDAARDVFWRFDEVYQRGHIEWMQWARRLEDIYLGGGLQWRSEDRRAVEDSGRPAHEVNTVLPTVNAAAGYQIANRVDIAYTPKRGEASEELAKVLSKVVRHSLENTKYQFRETEAFLDGLIQQRGYLDIRMSYEDSTEGEVCITNPDPLDVIPDPDAKEYDPDTWSDVRISRFLTLFEIEGIYGKDAADMVKAASNNYIHEEQFGTEYVQRSSFGNLPPSYAMNIGWYQGAAHHRRYRVVDQQTNVYANSLVAVWPGGDMRVVEGLPREQLAWMIDHGVQIMKRRIRRVEWKVAAPEVCFVDQLSPYQHFTIVPYFPYFRRGRTIGMIDNMVSPTEMLNKFVSQYAHVINSVANGGWQGEAGVLVNMEDSEFTERGAETGLVLLRKQGTQPFQKIEPNKVPTGIEHMVTFAHDHLNIVSGVDENLRDPGKKDLSGVAIQSLQYASQQKLALPLSNLSLTRHMVADRVRECVQRFMGNERLLRITEADQYGVDRQVPLAVNVMQEDGTVWNDLTVGEYGVTISEKPAAITFDNSDFEQYKAMKVEMGMQIPDAAIIRASSVSNKSELAETMAEQAGQTNPVAEAEAALKQAQARFADANAVAKSVEAQFSAIQTAGAIVVTPQSAALADALLRSAGFVDKDAAPIVPEAPPGMEPPIDDGIPENTHPLAPANPAVGMTRGLNTDPAIQP